MFLAEFGSGQALWTIFYLFLFMIWFWLLIVIFGDIFRSDDMGGFAKAIWVIFVILLPYLGILVYLIARGHGMNERSIAAAAKQKAQFDTYVQQTAAASGDDPASKISKAKELLDSGAISQAEFDKLKQSALS